MSSLSEAIGLVRRRIAQYKGKGLTEQDTKTALIDPILRALRWDVGNLDEVRMEYKAAPAHNPVDYALLVSGEVRLLVEAKALDQHLEGGRWANKIMGYAGAAGAEWVVLTNGDEYRIYNACAPVPFDKKLFRQPVRITASGPQANETEETLILLSKDRIDGIREQWERYFDDGQVQAALERIFSAEGNQRLVPLVKKFVDGLPSKRIRASVSRLCTQLSFRPESTSPPPPLVDPVGSTAKEVVYRLWEKDNTVSPEDCMARAGNRVKLSTIKSWFSQWKVGKGLPRCAKEKRPPTPGPKDAPYRKFWDPIRSEPNGLFAGKPAGRSWILKRIRGIGVVLYLTNHDCSVRIMFAGEHRDARRRKALRLFPASKYVHKTHESKNFATICFPVLDKGKKDRDHWPKIREKLTKLGEDIFRALSESNI